MITNVNRYHVQYLLFKEVVHFLFFFDRNVDVFKVSFANHYSFLNEKD